MNDQLQHTLKYLARIEGGAKHEALCQALVLAIEHGVWKPGEKLPTEQELAAACPLSLGTIQRAVRSLVERGLVVRRRGAGTFVSGPQQLLENPLHCRFISDGNFLPVYSKLISRRLIAETGPWSRPLQQEARSVLRIDRQISVNHEFKVFSRFYVDLRRFPSLLTREAQDLAAMNIRLLIQREYGISIPRVEQLVSVEKLPQHACLSMDVKPGTSGIRIDLMGLERGGRTVTYQEIFIPPNPYRVVVSSDFSPEAWGDDAAVLSNAADVQQFEEET